MDRETTKQITHRTIKNTIQIDSRLTDGFQGLLDL